jgi:hypothetical protein
MSHPEASGRERARLHLAEALARYHALGMARHGDLTAALLAAAPFNGLSLLETRSGSRRFSSDHHR